MFQKKDLSPLSLFDSLPFTHSRESCFIKVNVAKRKLVAKESRRQVPWELAFTSYCLFSMCVSEFLLIRTDEPLNVGVYF